MVESTYSRNFGAILLKKPKCPWQCPFKFCFVFLYVVEGKDLVNAGLHADKIMQWAKELFR